MKRSLKKDLSKIRNSFPGEFCKNKQHQICCDIVERGDLELLRYAREKQKYQWTNNILTSIIQAKSMPIFYYCLPTITYIPYENSIYTLLAKHNCYEMMVNLVAKNLLQKRDHLLSAAAYYGRVEMITYAMNNHYQKSPHILDCAVEAENLDIVNFLLEHDFPCTVSALKTAIRKKNIHIIDYLLCRVCSLKDCYYTPNHVEIARYLKENGCKINPLLCLSASQDNNFDLLKYAYENGGTLDDPKMMIYAIEYENYEMIDYIYEKTGKISRDAFSKATSRKMVEYLLQKDHLLLPENGHDSVVCDSFISTGKLELLQWLVEHNFRLPHTVCQTIILQYKCYESICYLHKKGYPLTIECASLCAYYGTVEMMKYVWENKCPWDRNILLSAMRNKDIRMYHFVRKHYPFSDTDFLYHASLSSYNKHVLLDLCQKKEPLTSNLFPSIIRSKWSLFIIPYLFQNQASYTQYDINKVFSICRNHNEYSLLYHMAKYVKLTPRQMKPVTRYTRRFSFLEQHFVKDLVGMVIDFL